MHQLKKLQPHEWDAQPESVKKGHELLHTLNVRSVVCAKHFRRGHCVLHAVTVQLFAVVLLQSQDCWLHAAHWRTDSSPTYLQPGFSADRQAHLHEKRRVKRHASMLIVDSDAVRISASQCLAKMK